MDVPDAEEIKVSSDSHQESKVKDRSSFTEEILETKQVSAVWARFKYRCLQNGRRDFAEISRDPRTCVISRDFGKTGKRRKYDRKAIVWEPGRLLNLN